MHKPALSDINQADITRFMLRNERVRGVIIEADSLIAHAQSVHGLEGMPAVLLGQTLMASMALLSISKGGVRQVLQLDAGSTTAPILRIQAETRQGAVRGYLNWNPEPQPGLGERHLLSSWLGQTILTSTIRDLGFGQPYISTIEHQSDYLADHIIHYLLQSTQIRADLAIIDRKAMLIEAMPECSDEHWSHAVTLMASIDNQYLAEHDAVSICEKMDPDDCQFLGVDHYHYRCHCNAESIYASLQTFSHEQLKELANEHGEIALSCQYCKKQYARKID